MNSNITPTNMQQKKKKTEYRNPRHISTKVLITGLKNTGKRKRKRNQKKGTNPEARKGARNNRMAFFNKKTNQLPPDPASRARTKNKKKEKKSDPSS